MKVWSPCSRLLLTSKTPQTAKLLPWIFCAIKPVRLEGKMVSFVGVDLHLFQSAGWVFAATWWNDFIFSVSPQRDSERHTSIYSNTHTHRQPAENEWLWEHANNRETQSLSLNHPVEKLCVCVCCVKPLPSPDWKVCRRSPSLSTVIHKALTSEDRDSRAAGALHYEPLHW